MWLVHRMEELDIIIPDYSGNPVSFTKNFCKFAKSFDIKNKNLIEKIIIDYIGNKRQEKDDIDGFVKLASNLITAITSGDYTLDQFRLEIVQMY